MGRKVGSGNVVVDGTVMTTQMYKDAVVSALQHNGNNWMLVDHMVSWCSTFKLCEKKDSPRRAATHPMWKIISLMMEEQNPQIERIKHNGRYMYRLKNPKMVYVNGLPYEVK